MSPGAAGYPGTYHKVRVYVGGVESNAADFFIDPAVVNPSSTSYIAWSAVGSEYNWQTVTRTANRDTRDGVQGYDYEAPDSAWLGNYVRGSNILFQNCTFTCDTANINGDYGGIVTVGQNNYSHNVTFLNCTFKENWSTNSLGNVWHGINGLKVVTYAHDITVSDCTFERFSRMAFETNNWSAESNVPAYLALRNCTFEPPGNQVISFGSQGDVYSIVENCLFKGWGNHPVMYPSGSACWESNGARYIITRGCTWWCGSTEPVNTNQRNGSDPCHLYFENCKMYSDTAHHYSLQRDYMYQWAVTIAADGMNYSRWKDCVFVTGDATMGVESFGATNWGSGPVQWAATNNYNDFSGSTITGYIRKGGLHIPASAAGYLDPGSPVLAGNILPKRM